MPPRRPQNAPGPPACTPNSYARINKLMFYATLEHDTVAAVPPKRPRSPRSPSIGYIPPASTAPADADGELGPIEPDSPSACSTSSIPGVS